MKPVEIPTKFLANIRGGREIVTTVSGGVLANGVAKNGSPLIETYPAGAMILSDEHGRLIVGPIDIDAAIDLAERIAMGNARALTEPQAGLVLATALLGVFALLPEPPAEGKATKLPERAA
ncbi:hypothetical protein P6U16_08540 [Rhizobium sp. 32-5/1]|uniref:hypothetical protein n=1 Tax=Rhizobium sp. 32-5/1 TaxID=3019602 RepID=UPI00240D6EC6|nr:hypothetical protein [Rhizobium sp. 32-5/1]WEZ84606.1 hypothetical protein P6U16_08540 [Rhizobium sp. 32-5/1]